MGRRTITISDEAYMLLFKMKKEGESFTEVIKRIASERRRRPLSSFAGAWADSSEIDEIFREIAADWKRWDEALRKQRMFD